MPSSLRAEQNTVDALGDAFRRLDALALDREAVDYLPPVTALLLDGDELGGRTHSASGRHGRRKTDSVPPHVDAERDLLEIRCVACGDLLATAIDDAERQVAVRDRGAG